MGGQPRRHHYVPRTYLRSFAADDGLITVIPKDSKRIPFRTGIVNIAAERDYYAQPKADGNVDFSTIERLFSDVESHWPHLIEEWNRGGSANERLEAMFQFLGLMRFRVPAARDVTELAMAATVRATMNELDRRGELPPLPPELKGIKDQISISIDPHQSLMAMTGLLSRFALIVDRLGFQIIHNETGIDFLTTDNPVCYYTPGPLCEIKPYQSSPELPLELMMPISPRLILHGHSDLKQQFACSGVTHQHCQHEATVEQFNEITCRFGYRLIFARELPPPGTKLHLEVSPTLRVDQIARGFVARIEFGSRREKARWR
jgi:hypothetical protein